MTKKLTGKELEKLVGQVLSEKKLPIDMKTAKGRQRAASSLAKDIGFQPNEFYHDKLKSLAGLDKDDTKLQDKDIEKAFASNEKNDDAATAYDLATAKDVADDLKNDVAALYKGSDYEDFKFNSSGGRAFDPNGYEGKLKNVRKFLLDASGKLPLSEKSGIRTQNVMKAIEFLKATDNETKAYIDAMIKDTALISTGEDEKEQKYSPLIALMSYAKAAVNSDDSIDTKPNSRYAAIKQAYIEHSQASLKPSQNVERGGLERKTITAPEISTLGIEGGQMLETQFKMFEQFAGSRTGSTPRETLALRIKDITDFTESLSQKLTNEEKEEEKKPKEGYIDFLNKTMVLDYFNKMALELDSMSGAYTFEAFCAYLAGGISGGKTPGLTGKMGATDFSFADGSKGSAKYLQSKTGFKQSTKDFVQGESITYVFASKRDVEGGGVSDPGSIYSIEMYVVELKLQSHRTTAGTGSKDDYDQFIVNDTGEPVNIFIKDGSYNFTLEQLGKPPPVGTLKLRVSDEKLITDGLEELGKDIGDKTGKFIKLFKETMQSLLAAKDGIEVYSNTGDVERGINAAGKLEEAGQKFTEFVNIVEGDEVFGTPSVEPTETQTEVPAAEEQATEKPAVQESKKITSKFLKKIIEESFKK